MNGWILLTRVCRQAQYAPAPRAADERKASADRSRNNFGTGRSTPRLKATSVSRLVDRFEPFRRRTVLFFLYGQMDK